jgi:hypothetical protein
MTARGVDAAGDAADAPAARASAMSNVVFRIGVAAIRALAPGRARLAGLAAAACLVAHCGDGDDGAGPGPGGDPCRGVYRDRCGLPCADDGACADGLFCGNGACTAQCTPEGGCGEGATCSPRGRCVGGGSGGAGAAGGPGFGGGPGGPGGQGGGSCPGIDVQFTPVTPVVDLLVDKSGSMKCPIESAAGGCLGQDDPGADGTRWRTLRESLLAGDGLLKRLESKAYLGVTFYTSLNDVCPPRLESLAPALDNYDEIATFYEPRPANFEPQGDTPTGASLRSAVDALATVGAPAGSPRFVVLCTDGIPNLCSDGDDTAAGTAEAVAAAKYGFARNVKTLVVGVGAFVDTVEGRAHFQAMADAGVGFGEPGGSPAQGTYYLASDPTALIKAFDEIRLGVRSCSFDLDATITPEAAPKGTVTVDTQTKAFNDPDGWRLVGNDRIEFVGAACDQIEAGAVSVRATFPCGTSGVTPKPR